MIGVLTYYTTYQLKWCESGIDKEMITISLEEASIKTSEVLNSLPLTEINIQKIRMTSEQFMAELKRITKCVH